MSRGVGEFGPVQEVIPEWAVILVALVTQLGDVWFLALLVGALYWVRTSAREDAIVVIGLTIAGLSVLTGLKHVFALPRPRQPLVELETLPWLIQPLYEATAMASGYGFPSGHAVMTTIVYVSLAGRLSVGTRRQRYLAAGLLVTAVCLSRVALGVHYLVDVVAGVGVGLVFLLAAEWVLARFSAAQGTVALSLAVVAAAWSYLASGPDPDSVLLLGTALGTFGGWQLVRLGATVVALERPSTAARELLVRCGLVGGAFAPLLAALGVFSLWSAGSTAGAVGLACGAFVTIPVVRHSAVGRRCLSLSLFLDRLRRE